MPAWRNENVPKDHWKLKKDIQVDVVYGKKLKVLSNILLKSCWLVPHRIFSVSRCSRCPRILVVGREWVTQGWPSDRIRQVVKWRGWVKISCSQGAEVALRAHLLLPSRTCLSGWNPCCTSVMVLPPRVPLLSVWKVRVCLDQRCEKWQVTRFFFLMTMNTWRKLAHATDHTY